MPTTIWCDCAHRSTGWRPHCTSIRRMGCSACMPARTRARPMRAPRPIASVRRSASNPCCSPDDDGVTSVDRKSWQSTGTAAKNIVVFRTIIFRKITSALAIGLMALNVLWPLIANADPRSPPFNAGICTANRTSGAQGADADKLPVQIPAEKLRLAHCDFCTSGSCSAPLPDAMSSAVTPSDAAHEYPWIAAPFFGNGNSFLLAQSRAPPDPILF